MAFVVACSKIWDPELVLKLKATVPEEFHFLTQKEQLTEEFLNSIKAKKIFFPHWSYIIKPEIFNNFECVIFHMTDLPYGRGGSPLQNLIARGHKETKISALRCAEGIDTGPVYLKENLSLEGSAQEIFIRATDIIKKMIIKIIKTNPSPIPQEGEVVEFKRRKEEDGNLRDLTDQQVIYDYIRMLDADGYPRAFLQTDLFKFEFEKAHWNGEELNASVRIKKL